MEGRARVLRNRGSLAGVEPLDIRRPFTRADALAAGISPKVLRGSRFRHVFRGVSVAADAPDSPVLRVEAALLLFDGAAFASHRSAARVHGVPLPPHPLEHVSVPTATLRRRPDGVRCHVCSSASVVVVRGLRVSDPRQMFVELATLLSLVDLVVVGDNLVRRGLCTLAGLVDFCASSEMAGAAAARAAASLVRDRVDSPMETRLRMLIVLAGVPEPEVNTTIRDVDGEPIRRYDLSWPSVRVIVEYDGRHPIEREHQWERDLDRREAIDDDGWRLLVVTSRGIYREPERTVQRIFTVLAGRGLAGLPRRPSEAWRPHFGR